jgi:hypothetical protein
VNSTDNDTHSTSGKRRTAPDRARPSAEVATKEETNENR